MPNYIKEVEEITQETTSKDNIVLVQETPKTGAESFVVETISVSMLGISVLGILLVQIISRKRKEE